MDNLEIKISEILSTSIRDTSDWGVVGYADATDSILKLLTPKLQWKSEEISRDGGSTLLATIHSVTNYHTSIQVYQPVVMDTYVNWNGNIVFVGKLNECKQFCSDKILNDFLKLCE